MFFKHVKEELLKETDCLKLLEVKKLNNHKPISIEIKVKLLDRFLIVLLILELLNIGILTNSLFMLKISLKHGLSVVDLPTTFQ